MRITSKGQVTIPIELREQAGLLPGTEVELDGDGVRLTRSPNTPSRGAALIELMTGRGTVALSTDEIMALTRG